MKQIERFSLIDKIGRELQSRMTYTDIDVYLKGFGVDTSKSTSGANSKWVYVKGLLGNCPEAIVLRIADELNIQHTYSNSQHHKPSDTTISDTLKSFDADGVHAVWQKALERRTTDPEGAITTDRTLLETVCKHILDSAGVQYDDKMDLPLLYKRTSEELNLAPSQHTFNVFKQILGGVISVVTGLGALRNKISDAHGQGKRPVRPAARHAELAVNLAGALALFLIETWLARSEKIT